jgi:cohesin complex subunit SA-1/2
MRDLVNCVLKSSGSNIKVSEDDINDPDNIPNRLADIHEESKTQSTADYPLVARTKAMHGFKETLQGFFMSLMALMHETSVLYDDVALIENIHLWVSTMSSGSLRPFRHTATVVSMACATGLCEVVKTQTDTTAKNRQALEKEKKSKGAVNKGRIDAWQKKVDEGESRREAALGTIKDFFDTVFVHRYRDVDAKVRADCVEALGQWTIILPDVFLEGTYLRYMGWLLSDADHGVRHKVVEQLTKIMSQREVGNMISFIERFRPRLIELATGDVDSGVRAGAVGLLDLVREKGMLEPDDIETIGKLIFDSDARVRRAVVGFFTANIKDLHEAKVDELGGAEGLEEASIEDAETWLIYKALAEEFLNYDSNAGDEEEEPVPDEMIRDGAINPAGFESRNYLAAEVLYDHLKELQDWETLAEYLLYDHSKKVKGSAATVRNAFKLGDKEDGVLLEVLHASVKTSLHRMSSEDHPRRKKTIRIEGDEEEAARKLASLLPRLLKKFGPSPKTSIAVLRLEHLLNLGIFQELREQDTGYKSLLHEINSQFKTHADGRVLKEASVSLLHAQNFEDLQETTEAQIIQLWSDTIDELWRLYPNTPQPPVRGDMSVDKLLQLTATVNRLAKLASIANPVLWLPTPGGSITRENFRGAAMTPIDVLLEIVGRGLLDTPDPDIDDEEDKLVVPAIQTLLYFCMWYGKKLKDAAQKGVEGEGDTEINSIVDTQKEFTRKLVGTLSSRAGLDTCRLVATGALLEVHILWRTVLRVGEEAVKKIPEANGSVDYINFSLVRDELAKPLEAEVQDELLGMLASAEKQYAKKARKTLEPPADDDEPEAEDSDEEEEDDVDGLTEAERYGDALKAELQLCDLASKLVLAALTGVVDTKRFTKRLLRNKRRLGSNVSQVLSPLEAAVAPPAKKKASKAKAAKKLSAEDRMRGKMKSLEIVQDESDEEEEVDEEEARARELEAEEGPPESVAEEEEQGADEDVEMLGD